MRLFPNLKRRPAGQSSIEVIEEELTHGFTGVDGDQMEATFTLFWDLRRYLETEYTIDNDLKSIVTITGTPTQVYVNSCAAYMHWCWESTSYDLLAALETAIRSGVYETSDKSLKVISFHDNPQQDQAKLEVILRASYANISIVAQQLTWLSCALQTTQKQAVTMSSFTFHAVAQGHFEIRPETPSDVHDADGTGWLSLLPRMVIAQGFPIPSRGEETGVELPLSLAVQLARTPDATMYELGIVFSGFSSLLYPTRLTKDRSDTKKSRIQWHLISSGSPTTYLPIVDTLDDHKKQWICIEDKDLVQVARSFLA